MTRREPTKKNSKIKDKKYTQKGGKQRVRPIYKDRNTKSSVKSKQKSPPKKKIVNSNPDNSSKVKKEQEKIYSYLKEQREKRNRLKKENPDLYKKRFI